MSLGWHIRRSENVVKPHKVAICLQTYSAFSVLLEKRLKGLLYYHCVLEELKKP